MSVGPKEFSLACQIVKMLWTVLPQRALIWHTANETGGAGKRRGAQNKRLGVRPGVPDYMILIDASIYAIEVKRPGESLSKNQRIFRTAFVLAGGRYGIARSVPEAYDHLTTWGLVR